MELLCRYRLADQTIKVKIAKPNECPTGPSYKHIT